MQYTMELLKKDYAKELRNPGRDTSGCQPRFRQSVLMRQNRRFQKNTDRQIRNPYDLEPEEEHLIGQYAKEECGADFVFVTHYPSKKRPFYAMDDPTGSEIHT